MVQMWKRILMHELYFNEEVLSISSQYVKNREIDDEATLHIRA